MTDITDIPIPQVPAGTTPKVPWTIDRVKRDIRVIWSIALIVGGTLGYNMKTISDLIPIAPAVEARLTSLESQMKDTSQLIKDTNVTLKAIADKLNSSPNSAVKQKWELP